MKAIIKLAALVAAASFAIISCEKPNTEEPDGPAGGSEMAITAKIVSSVGKTEWAKGDKLTVYSDADTKGTELTAKSGGASATFEGKAIEGDKYCAVYPTVEGATYASSKLTYNLPATIKYVDGALPAEYLFAASGDFTSGLTMTPVFAPIELTITGTCAVASLSVSGKNLQGADVAMSGSTEIDYSSKIVYANPQGDKNLTVTTEGLVVSGTKVVYLFAPAGQYSELTVTLTDGDGATKAATVSNATLNAGQVQKVGINHSAAISLSASATSNCYMLYGAGNYSFATKLVDGTAVEGDAADYLWSTVECEWTPEDDGQTDVIKAKSPMNPKWVISEVEYDKAKGLISFTASGNPGTAVIALYRNDGAARVIVWSWHIWVTDTPIENMAVKDWQSKHLVEQDITLTWLDRNIGALTAKNVDNAGIHGHLYQWGRKDPFPGGSQTSVGTTGADGKFSIKELKETAKFGEYTMPWIVNEAFGTNFEHVTEITTVAESAKTPMTFSVSGSWASDVAVNAWGDGVANYELGMLWAIGTDAKETYSVTKKAKGPKANYDPCPQGYRVPTASELYNSFASWTTDGGNPDLDANWDGNITTSRSKRNYGRLFKSFSNENNTIRIPCSGMREGGIMKGAGSVCYYWTATIDAERHAAGTDNALRWIVGTNLRFISNKMTSKIEAGPYGSARPVRCIAVY